MRPGSKEWTEAETTVILEMRAAGYGAAAIAPVLGRSRVSVQNRISNLPISAPPKPAPAPCERRCASRAEFVTATLMGDPPHGRSALDQRVRP
jgi:hypothetical protein